MLATILLSLALVAGGSWFTSQFTRTAIESYSRFCPRVPLKFWRSIRGALPRLGFGLTLLFLGSVPWDMSPISWAFLVLICADVTGCAVLSVVLRVDTAPETPLRTLILNRTQELHARLTDQIAPDGWEVPIRRDRPVMQLLFGGRRILTLSLGAYSIVLVGVIFMSTATYMDPDGTAGASVNASVAYNATLLTTLWLISGGLTAATVKVLTALTPTIQCDIRSYTDRVIGIVGYSGLLGTIAGALAPVGAAVLESTPSSVGVPVRSLSPSLLLDTTSIGAAIGFTIGIPMCLPFLTRTRNALYQGLAAPMTFGVFTWLATLQDVLPLTPSSLSSVLSRRAAAAGIQQFTADELQSLSLHDASANWARLLAPGADPKMQMHGMSDRTYIAITVTTVTIAAIAGVVRRARENAQARDKRHPEVTASPDGRA